MNEQSLRSRGHLIGFSVTGALITILFFAYINFSTGVRFPWFIFPSYAVLWWPLATIFAGRHSAKVLSLFGSTATIVLLVLTNYLTSWNYPWFLYPSFALLWWPLGVFFGARHRRIFSIAGSVVLILFCMIANYISSPDYLWFYYPVFAVLWWPLSVLLARPRAIKVYSVVGALFILAFLAADNLLHVPGCPWVLFTVYPVLMWPVVGLLGRRAGRLSTALLCGSAGIAYYAALNLFVFKGFPWVVFPAYALLWWPLAIAFAKHGHLMRFSVTGSALSIVFFILVNMLTTPHVIWAVYPIFALVWWPLATYYFIYKKSLKKLPQ